MNSQETLVTLKVNLSELKQLRHHRMNKNIANFLKFFKRRLIINTNRMNYFQDQFGLSLF